MRQKGKRTGNGFVEPLEQRLLLSSSPYLVADINNAPYGSDPSSLTYAKGQVYFAAGYPINSYPNEKTGGQAWRTDASAAVAVRISDIPAANLPTKPANFTEVNGTVFFTAMTSQGGTELWKTDGTLAGTTQLTFDGINPTNLIRFGDTLYFSAFLYGKGREIWRSDGTVDGTIMLKDVNTTPLGSGTGGDTNSANVGNLFIYKDAFYFIADDGIHGTELWRSDGTAAGTKMVKDIEPGQNGSSPFNFAVSNGIFFFSAYTSAHGVELWRTDGTQDGTYLVHEISGGSSSTNMSQLVDVNGTLYFVANSAGIWKSDGTDNGTVPVATPLGNIKQLIAYKGSLYYSVEYVNAELWKLTDQGPTLTGSVAFGKFGASAVVVGNSLYFGAKDTAHGFEIWQSDGTAGGTNLLKDVYAGTTSSNPASLLDAGGTLYFVADDGIHGRELWKSDGTASGTVLAADAGPVSANSDAQFFTRVGNQLFFTADNSLTGVELYVTDGTSEGTHLVKDIYPGFNSSFPGQLIAYKGMLFFTARDATHGTELWKSDGTDAGTVLVKDIDPSTSNGLPRSSSPILMTVSGNTLYFDAQTAATGIELWKTDGTEAGTTIVMDIRPGTASSTPNRLTDVDGRLFFVTYISVPEGTGGAPVEKALDLWRTDDVSGQTVLVKSFQNDAGPGSSNEIGALAAVGNTLYFNGYDAANAYQAWKSDGTPQGTVRVGQIPFSIVGGGGSGFTGYNGMVLFVAIGSEADNSDAGAELYRTDGTTQGTVRVKDIYPGPGSGMYFFEGFVPLNGAMYFIGYDGEHGPQVWRTDGTDAGTVAVTSLSGRQMDVLPHHLLLVDGALYFLAADDSGQTVLWRVDPSSVLGASIAAVPPRPPSFVARPFSPPYPFGHELYFAGGSEIYGTELFALNPSGGAEVQLGTGDAKDQFRLRIRGSYLDVYANPPADLTGVTPSQSLLIHDINTLRLNGGTFIIDQSGGLGDVGIDVGAGGPSTKLRINAAQIFRSLSVGEGGTVELTAGGAADLTVNSFQLKAGARVDLADNRLILTQADQATSVVIRNALHSAYAGGTWTGEGIGSSTLGSSGTIGYWTVGNQLVVHRTSIGDVNGDAAVGFADLVAVAQSYGRPLSSYAQGDLDFDGAVGFSDLVLVAQHYNSIASAAQPAASLPVAAMPLKPIGKAVVTKRLSTGPLRPKPVTHPHRGEERFCRM